MDLGCMFFFWSQRSISVRAWPSLGSIQLVLSSLVGGVAVFFFRRTRGILVMGFWASSEERSGERGMMAKSVLPDRSFSVALLGAPVSRVMVSLGWVPFIFFRMSGSMLVLAVTEQ